MLRSLLDYLSLLADAAGTVVSAPGVQRWRRLRFLFLFAVVFPWLFVVGQLTLALDHLLFPGFRKVELRKPVFIVGQPRTGTTYLYRLLAQDSDTFVTFRLVDFLFPSITLKRLAAATAAIDRALGGFGLGLLERVDRDFLPDFAAIHRVGFLLPEEDEYLLYHLMCSGTMWLLFPGVERFRRLLFLDSEAPPAERRRVTARYEALAKRHLYQRGAHRILLSKNPWFTGKIESLAEAFPDARFVKLERSPLEAIPSAASMLHFSWHNTGALPPRALGVERVIEIFTAYDRHARRCFAALGPERSHALRFRALVSAPADEVGRLLARLGVPVSPAMGTILASEGTRQQKRKSRHRYGLAEWGLDEAWVRERFPEAMEAAGDA